MFETTSTSPKKSFGNGNQEIYESRVQTGVDELSRCFLAMPRLPPISAWPSAISHKANRVDHWVVSRSVGGCLTDFFIFIYQDSESAQTLRGLDPPMHHLSRAKFSRRLAQGCGYGDEITVFLFLKTFFGGAPHIECVQPLTTVFHRECVQLNQLISTISSTRQHSAEQGREAHNVNKSAIIFGSPKAGLVFLDLI